MDLKHTFSFFQSVDIICIVDNHDYRWIEHWGMCSEWWDGWPGRGEMLGRAAWGALGVGLWSMVGRWGVCGGSGWEGCWVERMVGTRMQRGDHAMCRMSAQWMGLGCLGGMGQEGFGTVWGGCGDGGVRERIIWSGIWLADWCGDVVAGFGQVEISQNAVAVMLSIEAWLPPRGQKTWPQPRGSWPRPREVRPRG